MISIVTYSTWVHLLNLYPAFWFVSVQLLPNNLNIYNWVLSYEYWNFFSFWFNSKHFIQINVVISELRFLCKGQTSLLTGKQFGVETGILSTVERIPVSTPNCFPETLLTHNLPWLNDPQSIISPKNLSIRVLANSDLFLFLFPHLNLSLRMLSFI